MNVMMTFITLLFITEMGEIVFSFPTAYVEFRSARFTRDMRDSGDLSEEDFVALTQNITELNRLR